MDEPGSLILRYLCRIDEWLERIDTRLDQLTHRIRVLEETTAALAHGVAVLSGWMDDFDLRVVRIERRLELVEV